MIIPFQHTCKIYLPSLSIAEHKSLNLLHAHFMTSPLPFMVALRDPYPQKLDHTLNILRARKRRNSALHSCLNLHLPEKYPLIMTTTTFNSSHNFMDIHFRSGCNNRRSSETIHHEAANKTEFLLVYKSSRLQKMARYAALALGSDSVDPCI